MPVNLLTSAVQRLSEAHAFSDFDSGVHSLTRFLHKHARRNDTAGYCRVYVICPEPERPVEVKAYYTLSMSAVEFKNIPPGPNTPNLPKYPMPTVLLGRLAVDRRFQQRGYGRVLLVDAMLRALHASTQIGARALVVDAVNEAARSFYLKFGFSPFLDDPAHLFLPVQTIARLGAEGDPLQGSQHAQTALNSRSE